MFLVHPLKHSNRNKKFKYMNKQLKVCEEKKTVLTRVLIIVYYRWRVFFNFCDIILGKHRSLDNLYPCYLGIKM